jgi:hypothetical protein
VCDFGLGRFTEDGRSDFDLATYIYCSPEVCWNIFKGILNRAEEPHPAERIGTEVVLGLHKVTQQVPNQRMPL